MYEKTRTNAAAAGSNNAETVREYYIIFFLRYYCWQQWVPVNRACVLVRRS